MTTERKLLKTNRFDVVEITVGGQPRQVIRHPGSVVIVPLLADNRVCLIRNTRHGVGKTLLEFPAGTRETNENPAETAFRELTEETGFTANTWEKLGEFYACPGISDEFMHIYLATDCEPGEPAREAGEEIENRVIALEELQQLAARGEIVDGKTIVSLFYLERWLGR
jgi:ADP-ribose pyrophosphatase